MQAVSVDFIPQAKPAVVEVRGQYGVRVAVANPRLNGDTLYGTAAGGSADVAVALREIEQIKTKRFSGARTAFLVGGLVAFAGATSFILANVGNSKPQLTCEFENPVDPYEREQCGV